MPRETMPDFETAEQLNVWLRDETSALTEAEKQLRSAIDHLLTAMLDRADLSKPPH